jgi:hypothetical protein
MTTFLGAGGQALQTRILCERFKPLLENQACAFYNTVVE